MDTEDLKIFLHLADTLHFGKTSAACHMSPSTLSRQIQRIEEEVGQQLFERDNRSVLLTESGVQFRKYAKESLGKWYERTQLYNKVAGPNITERDKLFPIPQSVIDANLTTDMRQNPGY